MFMVFYLFNNNERKNNFDESDGSLSPILFNKSEISY